MAIDTENDLPEEISFLSKEQIADKSSKLFKSLISRGGLLGALAEEGINEKRLAKSLKKLLDSDDLRSIKDVFTLICNLYGLKAVGEADAIQAEVQRIEALPDSEVRQEIVSSIVESFGIKEGYEIAKSLAVECRSRAKNKIEASKKEAEQVLKEAGVDETKKD